ncbi:MAG: LPS export ABC transporter ATP-binding protein, partial [Lentisphaerae bacterium]
TFYMLVGLISPDHGSIHFLDRDITSLPMYRRARQGIGYLSQEPSIFRNMTVWDNLMAVLETLQLSRREREIRAQHLLEGLKITHLAKQKARTLSGGERRRLEIARSMITGPKIIMLDEPFSGVDPKSVYEVQQLILQLKMLNLGVLITDHNVRETLDVVDRAYIIHQGTILCEGTSEFLVNDPKAREVYLGPAFKK